MAERLSGRARGSEADSAAFHDRDYRAKHETDVFGEKAERFVSRHRDKPWFAFVAFHSPHTPTFTEPKYDDNYGELEMPYRASLNEEDVSDKPAWVRELPRVSDEVRAKDTAHNRDRARAMRSVDDAVGDLLDRLKETGELENTYVVLWNDNGYHMGQHRLPKGKRTVYEEDVRYPMVVRGPGVTPDARDTRLVVGTDLLPTFLDMAGAPSPAYVDGRSLLPSLTGAQTTEPTPWRRSVLLEGYDDGFENKDYAPPDFKAIRTEDGRTYVEYATGEREFYRLKTDPYQMQSLHDDPAYSEEVGVLSVRLAALKDCSGDGCRTAEGSIP